MVGTGVFPKRAIAMRSKICVYSPHFSLVLVLKTGRRVIPCLFCEDEAFRIIRKSSDRAAKFLSQLDCVKIFIVSTNVFCYPICGLAFFQKTNNCS